MSSAQFYKDSLKTVKFPTFDGTRNQQKVNEFLNVFTVLKSLNSLDDADLVRLVVQHLRGPALLWWLEAADSGRSQQLLSSWENFKVAFRQRFVPNGTLQPQTRKSCCTVCGNNGAQGHTSTNSGEFGCASLQYQTPSFLTSSMAT